MLPPFPKPPRPPGHDYSILAAFGFSEDEITARVDYLRCSMSADAVRSGSANDHTRVDDLGRVSSS